ncbi:MAG TPA: helix-turn-helix transcriptional regulator [Solirubrobacteraceae bacterium]|nr:helix-turn-helix transcriptional regulator [Solirubrobacteraceae bacterium]
METSPSLVALGRAVRELRVARGLNQRELGERVGHNQRSYIGHVEQGRRNATYETLSAIAAALGVSLSELVARAEVHERDRSTGYRDER